jgi:hypothetical protein
VVRPKYGVVRPKYGVVPTKYGVVSPKRDERERKGTRRLGIQPMHAHQAAISGDQWRSEAISGNQWQSSSNQWPSLAIPMQSEAISGPRRTGARLTASSPSYRCRPRPPASAPYRAHVGQGIRSRYNLGTVIRGNQAPYSSSPQGQSVAISGNQWQSVAISGNQWHSRTVRDNQGQSV